MSTPSTQPSNPLPPGTPQGQPYPGPNQPPYIPNQPYTGYAPPPPVPPKKKRRRWPWVLGVVVAMIFVAAVVTDDADTTANNSDGATQKNSTSSRDDSGKASTDTGGADTDSDKSDKAAEEKPKPAPKPVTYSGTGDEILDINKPDTLDVGYAKIKHTGSSNFAVETLGDDIPELLVNAIGNYAGTVAFDLDNDNANRVRITADGNWTIKLLPMERLRWADGGKVTGQGDDVFLYGSEKEAVAAITHNGESNFAVTTYGGDFPELLVNEIGSYSGEQLITGLSLVVINADGDWTMQLQK